MNDSYFCQKSFTEKYTDLYELKTDSMKDGEKRLERSYKKPNIETFLKAKRLAR